MNFKPLGEPTNVLNMHVYFFSKNCYKVHICRVIKEQFYLGDGDKKCLTRL